MEKTKLQMLQEQKQKMAQSDSTMRARIKKEEEKLEELKQQFDQTMQEQILSGEDKTDKLDKISEEIANQEELVERRKKEHQTFRTLKLAEVTSEDVLLEFNQEVVPKFKEERLDDILDRLAFAKVEYLNAVVDYLKSLKEFDEIKKEYKDELGDAYHYKLGDIALKNRDEKLVYLFDWTQIRQIHRGNVPNEIKHNPKVRGKVEI
ncbi:hypothetical protein [Ornithinibacillus scapharcae]|uniref:hypothetical protein n=1 Tax=Ornithinibacillus scapharcae TaxID=1147159 RepID=UPI000225B2DC|nr:hypothetical protein [Ornithinibacillus scapharcae]